MFSSFTLIVKVSILVEYVWFPDYTILFIPQEELSSSKEELQALERAEEFGLEAVVRFFAFAPFRR